MRYYPYYYRYRDADGIDHERTGTAPHIDWARDDARETVPPGGELMELGWVRLDPDEDAP